ncbi:MAG: GAF domain-containing protein [Actinobacteria bacterium]|nr:GAF domain-containing protein [Actinomycetota bacterium]
MAFGRRGRDAADIAEFEGQELAGLVVAARAINEAGDLDATLSTILDRALELLDADEGSVMLFTGDRNQLRIHAASGLPDHIVESTQVELGQGISGNVAATGTPLLLGTDVAVERYSPSDHRSRLRSAVCVPLRTRGRIEGVLNLALRRGGSSQREEFAEPDLELATLLAEFAAAAVHNGQLYAQARRRGDDMATLFEASHALSSAIEVEDVCAAILDAVEELIATRAGFVCALPEEGTGPEASRYRGLPRGRIVAAMRKEGFIELLRGSRVRVVDDLATDPVLNTLVGDGTPKVGVIAPLVGGGSTRGLLVSLLEEPPTDPQIRMLATYVHHAALALGKALLLRSVRTKEDEVTSLAASVPNPIIITDGAGRLLAVNPAASELFGLNSEFDAGTPVSGKLRSQELEDLILAEHASRADVTLLTPQPRTFRARATPVRPGHGPAGARILTLEDITSEKEMEQMKADFVAVIGHELRTPLTLIKGYTGTLAKRADKLSPEARSKALESIHHHTVRLERLVEDLLLVSRVERHRLPLFIERRDIIAAVEEVVAAVRHDPAGRDIRFEPPQAEFTMLFDVTKVEQVLHHLLDNALKFSEPGEQVEVEIDLNEDDIEVRIRDRGVGIFSGDVPRLFDRFQQLDGTATRGAGGTGIGLYICRTLVEAHGGRIGVRSALGRGSTFWFSLPTVPPEGGDGKPERDEQPVIDPRVAALTDQPPA